MPRADEGNNKLESACTKKLSISEAFLSAASAQDYYFFPFVIFVLICVSLPLTITAYLEFKIVIMSRDLSHPDSLDIKYIYLSNDCA